MAHLRGFTAGSVGHMLAHYTRHADDPEQSKFKYGNKNIDKARTRLNYAIFERDDPEGFIRSCIDGLDTPPRKNTSVLSDWVITLPRNGRLDGREREFFETAYEFFSSKVGSENVVGAWVHMDETQPHMHFAFVPRIESQVTKNDKSHPLRWTKKDQEKDPSHAVGEVRTDKKGTKLYRRVAVKAADGRPVTKKSISQAKMFSRREMERIHPQLSKAMYQHFGFDVGVELSDKGEKALSKLDQDDYRAAREAIGRQEAERDENQRAIDEQESAIERLEDKRAEIARQTAEESARLEELQRARARARGRVEALEAVRAECRAAESADVGRRGRALDRVAALCAGIVQKVIASLPEDVRRRFREARSTRSGGTGRIRIKVRNSVNDEHGGRPRGGVRKNTDIGGQPQPQQTREWTPSL